MVCRGIRVIARMVAAVVRGCIEVILRTEVHTLPGTIA